MQPRDTSMDFFVLEFPFCGGKAEGQVMILRQFQGSGRMGKWVLLSKKKGAIRCKNKMET